ncbi:MULTISPECIES: DivIVA domain-containing protein [Cryobacterium]|uniref:Cell wall synthesis protein Wag31 n=1 Tax=Cryobacterium zongtaii TaxID=1259217 RepID=A0A2S3Z7H3_9MICO|nr:MULTISPECIES: DivIVA domain-containing protein [Cryobacterium]ASD21999.1 cell division protein [Cryobacterium sp. LW097]MEC5185604.1 DivIVA domain-containing protein [Cryobacterium sp. MP_3.1]POH61533.1 DivIVA domain-containing protein [Cryobacterium zongtaii]POH64992.1 DivIVA domain-containing protein [Cryobacterium zongtaii]POH68090.1 DivIVA domain-containing protein [Cryobacterium zongtaii]
MALTPEDVVNKRFQSTKFREGYDQDEVDDFLDEVVVELRRLTQENEDLKARLSGGEVAPAAPVSAAAAKTAEPVNTPEPVAEPVAAVVPEPVAAAPVAPAPVAEPIDETAGTTNLLQLARRLHEEHVKEGAEKRDALIAEGHATAARVIAESEAKQRAQINVLDKERAVLENKIEELRTFEREYRQKLKSYIEGQLRDLDSTSPVGAGAGKDSGNSPKASFQGFGA